MPISEKSVASPDSALKAQIIGIVLVRNEDLFVRQAVENILDFCDRIFWWTMARRMARRGC